MFNFATYLISQGVSEQLIYLLLVLPFVAFLVNFSRYFIGLKTFGMYEPVVIAFSLYLISPVFAVGLKFGLPIILLAWLVSELFGKFLKETRLHYISKVSLKISVASLLMLLTLGVLARYNQNGYFTVDPLPIIVILALVESVGLFKIKVGDLRANLTSLETLLISIFAYLFIAIPLVKEIILEAPYLVTLPIIGSVLVGKWSGLRLSEYIRFRNISSDE